jgi:4-alpha-glucanotransferase
VPPHLQINTYCSLKHLSHPDREWHDTIRFNCYLQFKLHQQLHAASSALQDMGVVLKGDLPIGVNKCSVDTWAHPALFRMHTNTGAPPDYFDPKGQNWGFPTYNWEAMAKDDYAWWSKRLAHMAQYFQAYRIDHILGFFRIWELPACGKTGILGRYRPSIGYTRAELERQGLWDIDRLAEPFITDDLLQELLDDPELELEVKERFLEPSPGNRYRFKDKYNSESAMYSLKCRPGLPDATALDSERTRAVLIQLTQNVCLIKDQDCPSGNFYPRFNLVDTTSFQHIPDAHWKAVLRSMHDESFYGVRSDAMWRRQALQTLPMMQRASDMLVCGEDLGFIPPCVHPIMEELGILGLRIQRMPSEQGVEFADPETYGYMTVASPSSHDTTNFRSWYREDEDRRRRYAEQFGLPGGEAPGDCSPDTVRWVIRQHLNSPSMLAVFSIQDIIGMSRTLPQRDPDEETINVPSNPDHYWRYRMHVSVADLEGDEELRMALRQMIAASGRLRGGRLSEARTHGCVED